MANLKGAGRPKGSYSRPQIRDYVTKEEIAELVEVAKKQAKNKPELLKFLLEQVFGKAAQSVDLTSDGEKLATMSLSTLTNEQLESIAGGGNTGTSKKRASTEVA